MRVSVEASASSAAGLILIVSAAAYSCAMIVFAAIIVLRFVLNNITEIAVASSKVKPRIAIRSLGFLIVQMGLFSICTKLFGRANSS
jgi:hypothetical protein